MLQHSVITMDDPARFAQILGQSFIALIFLLTICAGAWGADAAGTVKTLAGLRNSSSRLGSPADCPGTARLCRGSNRERTR